MNLINDQLSLPRLLRLSEVATILSVSRTTAYRLAATGELPAVHFGAEMVRVRPEDLEEFILSKRRNGSSHQENGSGG